MTEATYDLVNGRHQMTCIGSSMTQKGQGGGDSKKGRYAIPKELVELLIDVNRDSVWDIRLAVKIKMKLNEIKNKMKW